MQFIFHGAGREVGRSCVEIDKTILLDAGLKITEHGTEYPSFFEPQKIQAVFLSHAHLDHTGSLPVLNHSGLTSPIYSTRMTRLMTEVLLDDSFHIELITHTHPGYGKENIFNVLQNFRDTEYETTVSVSKDLNAKFLDAGHIPGSASILLNYKKKNILYTGDINWQNSLLLAGAKYTVNNIDIMITEATYGDRNHPSRSETEQRFIATIKEILSKDGSVLLPAFAIGRAQELMLLLTAAKIECPIYLDGMAKKVTDLCLSNPMFVRNAGALREAHKKIQYITSEIERKRILQEKCIIITTSGMVTGGPVMEYLKMMFFEPKHGILLSGYQGDGTNGRLLLQEKCAYVDGKKVKWTGRIEQFDFSAHAGQDDLIAAVKRIQPKALILNHGDEIAIETMQDKLKKYVKKIYAPKIDEVLEVE
ncbi:MAG: MBL fold metallo-hydrolase [Nanoarchaeota archaeon]